MDRINFLCNFWLQKVPKIYLKESLEFERAFGAAIICLYPIMPAFSAQIWQSFRDVASNTEPEFNLVISIKLLLVKFVINIYQFTTTSVLFIIGSWSLGAAVAIGWLEICPWPCLQSQRRRICSQSRAQLLGYNGPANRTRNRIRSPRSKATNPFWTMRSYKIHCWAWFPSYISN